MTFLLVGIPAVGFAQPGTAAPPCDSLPDQSTATIPFSAIPGDAEENDPWLEYAIGSDLYIYADDEDVGTYPLYKEINGFPGLQLEPGSCDSTGDGFSNHRYTSDGAVPWLA